MKKDLGSQAQFHLASSKARIDEFIHKGPVILCRDALEKLIQVRQTGMTLVQSFSNNYQQMIVNFPQTLTLDLQTFFQHAHAYLGTYGQSALN